MKNDLTIVKHQEFGELKILNISGEVWFIAKELCEFLRYSNPSKAYQDHCKRLKLLNSNESLELKIKNPHPRGTYICPESDMYRLIMRSNQPFAEKIQDWVCEEVLPSIRKTGSYESKPNILLKRFQENRLRIKRGYFSIITESYNIFFQQFEAKGFELPLDFCPDISIGKMFCKWLRDTRNYNTGDLPKYNHHYPDGRVVEANMYPTDLWIPFLDYFIDIWLATHFLTYLNNKKTDESKQILDFVKSHSEMIDYSDSRKKISA